MGVLPLLDEESAIQSGSDANFVQKLRAAHEQGQPPARRGGTAGAGAAGGDAPPLISFPRSMQLAQFTIRHYAGSVTYDAAVRARPLSPSSAGDARSGLCLTSADDAPRVRVVVVVVVGWAGDA